MINLILNASVNSVTHVFSLIVSHVESCSV